MKGKRVFVEKKEAFRTEAERLRRELSDVLGEEILSLHIVNSYDLFGFSDSLSALASEKILSDPTTDVLYADFPYERHKIIASEYLPGQFDPRGHWAEACVRLLKPDANVTVRSGEILVFDPDTSDETLKEIESYYINPVEKRIKNLEIIRLSDHGEPRPSFVIQGFADLNETNASEFLRLHSLAMSEADLKKAVEYFKQEGRNPTDTELKIIDTYWSDHCRHTTFNTALTEIEIESSPYSGTIKSTLDEWMRIRKEVRPRSSPPSLMDLATIGPRFIKPAETPYNMEISGERNACGVYFDIKEGGERYLLLFKNETHNHPTEIEPFGGAATCLGGAVRDPLCGGGYVFQAVRVSGAGNIHQSLASTLPGKLPQRVISRGSAEGFSSYGNQLGIPTSLVREIHHPGYVAKRLEIGAVTGIVKADGICKSEPQPGDKVILIGGRTGRDGIGGATGSSKAHSQVSLHECSCEVQKGNAPEERKLLRLFKRPEVLRLIRSCNDFGAGGVSVAIGELAEGSDIYLDRIKTKYSGLSATELAVSESQERMAVVVDRKNADRFIALCHEENIEATEVAEVTGNRRIRMFFNGGKVADIDREFLDSGGAPRQTNACIAAPKPEKPSIIPLTGTTLVENLKAVLSDPNVVSQKGLAEMFDSTIGGNTVLMPFGGMTQRTPIQVAVQRMPVDSGQSLTGCLVSFGFNPYLTEWSPYHGAAYAVTEAVARAVAAGSDFRALHLSLQEYFERMTSPRSWGKPLAALLGALRMQKELGIPAIGGKDSMSGTYDHLSVPPTLIAFAFAPVDCHHIISPEFKREGNRLYLLKSPTVDSDMPDTSFLKEAWTDYHRRLIKGEIVSGYAIGYGGVAEAVCKMAFGNNIGAEISYPLNLLFRQQYGAILLETPGELPGEYYVELGRTVSRPEITVNGETIGIETLYEFNRGDFRQVFPDKTEESAKQFNFYTPVRSEVSKMEYPGEPVWTPEVYIPVFPGTNCDYDISRAFEREGGRAVMTVFRNLTPSDIEDSIGEMASRIDACHILALSGGFSAADEPDGSGKFIATVLMHGKIKEAIGRLLERGGLILGICNGFQALLRCGLLPSGKIGDVRASSPALVRNDIDRHVSQVVTLRVGTSDSPWLFGFQAGETFNIPVSHGEGKFVADEEMLNSLASGGRIAFQYADPSTGLPTMQSPYNPNGSMGAIEGIISPCGRILGKMAHSERTGKHLMKNIPGNRDANIFKNAIKYFRHTSNI